MLTEAAANSEPIDPTLLSWLSIFGGVGITAFAGFVGAWLNARREHARWLRERRFEAFVRSIALVDNLSAIWTQLGGMREADRTPVAGLTAERIEELLRRKDELTVDLHEVSVTLAILGPDVVDDLIAEVIKATLLENAEELAAARLKLTRETRKALSIRTGWSDKVTRWTRRQR